MVSQSPYSVTNKLANILVAYLFGIPTRYGNFPAQFKAFWDATGGLWATGALWGKYAGVFVSTAGLGGGQESTVIASISTLAHHGINYVPLGYKPAFPILTNLAEVHGGSPWGAGTFAVSLLTLYACCLVLSQMHANTGTRRLMDLVNPRLSS